MLPFRGLFVCPSVCHFRASCSNGRRYWHDFLSRSCKVWLASVNHFLPKFLLQTDSSPVYLSVRDIWCQRYLMTNCCRMVRDSNGHNGQPIGNHHCFFEWCHHWPPTTCTSPKMGDSKCTPRPILLCVLPPGEYVEERCHLLPKYFVPCCFLFLILSASCQYACFPARTDDVGPAGRVLQWWCTVLCRRVWTTRCGRNLTWSSSVCCISSGQQNTCRISTGCRRKTSQVYAFMAQRNRSHFK